MIRTSERPAVDVGGADLHGLVLAAARAMPDRVALIDGPSGAPVSYATLANRIGCVAAAMADRGLGPGRTAAVWLPNMPPWAGVALGTMAAGATVTGVPPQASDEELARQLEDAGARVVVTTRSHAARARAAGARAGVDVVTVEDALAPAPAAPVPVGDDALALLPYSSGTTAMPKGVMLTHRNLVTAVRQVSAHLEPRPGDTFLAVAPFAHVMGFVVTLAAPLAAGATVVTMPRFDVASFLELAERHRATVLVVPPPVMQLLAHHPLVEQHDLSALELIVSGGAPLGASLQRAVARRLPGVAVGQAWGMTETSVGISGPDRRRGTTPGSVGRLMPCTELRVVDPETGRDMPPGDAGELWVRGPQVTTGYRDRPEETAALLTSDGWLRTGDLGRVDASGDVFIVDRLKELLKVSGHQVAPAELEALLCTHPAVADAAVLGRADERHGEVPIAVVVARGELEAEQLMAWTAGRVAPYKRLREVRFTDALPRTPAGKLMRRLLAERMVEAA